MSFARALIVAALLIAALAWPAPGAAQTPARGKLIITVSDPSGAVIPDATVTIVGLDDSTKAVSIAPGKTAANGAATFEGLALGRYSITGEFAGFELGLLRDVRVNRGDNKHLLVLPLKNMLIVPPARQPISAARKGSHANRAICFKSKWRTVVR